MANKQGGYYRRTTAQREHDLVAIADLYLQGKPQEQIAMLINAARPYDLSQQTISNDIAFIRQRWRESTVIDFNERKQMELARLDALEREYWRAWERSKRDGEKREYIPDSQGQPKQNKLVVEGQTGNPAFLKGIEQCIALRCKLLGLFEPDMLMMGIGIAEDSIHADSLYQTFKRLDAERTGRLVLNHAPDEGNRQ